MTTESTADGSRTDANPLRWVVDRWRRLDRGWRAVAVAGIVTFIAQTGVPVPY
jgi:hypothetical protein